MFLTLAMKDGGNVKFGGNQSGKIIGTRTIGNTFISINNVWLVDGLKHNLLSISQFCDNGYDVLFNKTSCTVVNKDDNSIIFKGKRMDNVYKINFSKLVDQKVVCLLSVNDKKWVWHKRLGHANWRLISKLSKSQLVKGLPNIDYHSDALCGACQKGKIVKTSFKAKDIVSTSRPLELLHIDLFGLVTTESLYGSKYGLVIVDDYSRWTWVKFLRSKDCAYDVFSSFCTQIQSEKEMKILKVRSDHGGEFENEPLESFCEKHGIIHEFSSPRTPQQTGVVERKNRTLQEMARTMIHENNLAKHLWAEAVNTTCYIQNRIYIRSILEKTTYELFKGRRPNISYFYQFGCTCYILNTKLYLKKFDAKAQRGIFLGYSERSKAYKVYNSETLCVEESMDVKFHDKEPGNETAEQDESFADIHDSEDTPEPDQIDESKVSPEVVPTSEAQEEVASDVAQEGSQQADQSMNTFKYKSSHPDDQIIGNKESPIRTRSYFRPEEFMIGLLLVIEPTTVDEALSDDGWILAMQEELNQFQRNDVWDLVPKPLQKNIIGTKWVFRNKLNE